MLCDWFACATERESVHLLCSDTPEWDLATQEPVAPDHKKLLSLAVKAKCSNATIIAVLDCCRQDPTNNQYKGLSSATAAAATSSAVDHHARMLAGLEDDDDDDGGGGGDSGPTNGATAKGGDNMKMTQSNFLYTIYATVPGTRSWPLWC